MSPSRHPPGRSHPQWMAGRVSGTTTLTCSPPIAAVAVTVPESAPACTRRVLNVAEVVFPEARFATCFAPYGVLIDSATGTSDAFEVCTVTTALPATQRPVAVAVTCRAGSGSARTIVIVYVAAVV